MTYVTSLMKLSNMSQALWEEWITYHGPMKNGVLSFPKFLELQGEHRYLDHSGAFALRGSIEPNQLVDMDFFNILLKYASYLDEHNEA